MTQLVLPLALNYASHAGAVAALRQAPGVMSLPNHAPGATAWTSAASDIGVLVFREGLECVLVLAAITANMIGPRRAYQRPVFAGAALACLATLVTWRLAVGVIDDMSASLPAL